MDKIYEHYVNQAQKNGLSKKSTMPDEGVRELEINNLMKYMKKIISKKKLNDVKILELGCGNGYTASVLSYKFSKAKFLCTDVNREMIAVANSRNLKNVNFKIMSASEIDLEENSFDIIYTERCLMNLPSENDKIEAFKGIHKVLKPGGHLLLIETFQEGWDMLNKSRETLNIDLISEPWHNKAFNEEFFKELVQDKFNYSNLIEGNDSNFLSSYYFGSRVLYPALIENKKEIIYNNEFIQFFKYLPPILNYSPVQFRLLEKK